MEIDLKALRSPSAHLQRQRRWQPGPESSILKLNSTRVEQAINELSVDVLVTAFHGTRSRTVARPCRFHQPVVPRYLNNRAASIFGGPSEVQRRSS